LKKAEILMNVILVNAYQFGQKKIIRYTEQKKTEDEILNIKSFDGEILRSWGKNNKALLQIPIESTLANIFCGTPCIFHLFQKPFAQLKTWVDILNDRENFQVVLFPNTEKINNQSCYVLEATQKSSNFKYTLWIAPERGFMPVKSILTLKHAKYLFITEYKKFEQIWFPVSGKVEGLVKNEEGEILVHGIIEFEITDIEINKGIEDSFFQINFPKGTEVYDERTGINYIVK